MGHGYGLFLGTREWDTQLDLEGFSHHLSLQEVKEQGLNPLAEEELESLTYVNGVSRDFTN